MPRILIIRYEGSPFDIRMSKVIGTILDSGWTCDVLIPAKGLGRIHMAEEQSRDLSSAVSLYEFPVAETFLARLRQQIESAGYFGSREFKQYLAGRLRREHYDAILVRDSLCLPRVFQALTLARKRDVKVVCELYEPRVEQVYDSLIRFGNWSRRVGAYARFLVPRLRAAQRRWLPLCDHVFVVVEEMRSFLVDECSLDPSRISVVHNVEALDEFDRIVGKGVPPTGNGTRFSFVGSFGPHRGIDLVIDAVALVATRSRQPFHLALVGASRRELDRLQRLSRERGVERLVDLVGWVSHRHAMQWIKNSDVGLIPHVDTLGIRTTVPHKLFQYMSAGAACIVSDVGPLGRIVRETECGLTFRPGSVENLADRLSVVLENPAKARAMGANGRTHCEQKYRWEIEGEQYSRYLVSLKSDVRGNLKSATVPVMDGR